MFSTHLAFESFSVIICESSILDLPSPKCLSVRTEEMYLSTSGNVQLFFSHDQVRHNTVQGAINASLTTDNGIYDCIILVLPGIAMVFFRVLKRMQEKKQYCKFLLLLFDDICRVPNHVYLLPETTKLTFVMRCSNGKGMDVD